MISASTIEAVRDATDLAELVREYATLTRSARGFICRCVFHEEKTASMRVHTAGLRKGRYKCFGCSAAGNCFDFVMNAEGKTFTQAVEYLGERAGIAVGSGRRISEVQRRAEIEDRACCRWWWQQRWESTRAALDEALQWGPPESPAIRIAWNDQGFSRTIGAPIPDGYAFADCLGRILRWIEDLPRDKRMNHFLTNVREYERQAWRAEVAEDKKFAAAFMDVIDKCYAVEKTA